MAPPPAKNLTEKCPRFVPNVPEVRGFGETFQYAPGEYAPQRVSKVWPKPVTIGTLGLLRLDELVSVWFSAPAERTLARAPTME